MQDYRKEVQSYTFGAQSGKLWVPKMEDLRISFANRQDGNAAPFPYWAKLWPSAIALSRFLAAHHAIIKDKKVLELAAGLGLPGIVAAHVAGEVVISDYLPEAVGMMQASIALNVLTNITTRLLDWNALPENLTADVLLLSDINYAPAQFEVLYGVLTGFLSKGTTIVLATPQRLMARAFIEQLIPYCIQQEELAVSVGDEQVMISVLVLNSRTPAQQLP